MPIESITKAMGVQVVQKKTPAIISKTPKSWIDM